MYHRNKFCTKNEYSVVGHSRVDFTGLLDGVPVVLIEAKSPQVMKRAGDLLPDSKTKLKWQPNQSQALGMKILLKVSTQDFKRNTSFYNPYRLLCIWV